ncbi:MAG: aminodeoxychorismate/anthranilate synthase component II [Chloroflexota bacterium]|nr:aminodeoxychorismate/anthranilate synthase component II [Chloroflexota bacterium]
MILLLDNYDSFTFNLYQALRELGAAVTVVRNDQVTVDEVESNARELEGIVLSPGPCTPKEAGISVPLIKRMAGKVPILGVCLGHQAIGAAFGGAIIHAPSLVHGKTSEIHHGKFGVFAGLPTPFIATRYHSLVVERESLPSCLEVTAETSDGLIMGLRHRTLNVEGVQFHPESILTVMGMDLLANFVNRDAVATSRMESKEPAAIGY